MKRRERSAPIWLFSFVDLAFLLIIALTQVVPDPSKTGTPVALLELPRITEDEVAAAPVTGEPRWQLRVHPLPGSDDPNVERLPFELLEPGATDAPVSTGPAMAAAPERAASPSSGATRSLLDADQLAARLDLLRDRALPRPILAPHRDARSEDLLVAVALLERVWQSDRGVTVQPTPAIASAPAPANDASTAPREKR